MNNYYQNYIKIAIDYANSHFNQYNMPQLNKPYKFQDCVIFFWNCGGIVLFNKYVGTFSEDDGYWFETKDNSMSSSWLSQYTKCLECAKEYVEKHGKPYYFSGTEIICGYEI